MNAEELNLSLNYNQMSFGQTSDEKHSNGNGMEDLSYELSDIMIGDHTRNGSEGYYSGPNVHSAAEAPVCGMCRELESPFFNTHCNGCLELVSDLETTVGQLFAIMRQWVSQTQHLIELLVKEVLRRNAGVNDRDELTDMTLLMYASKAGAKGVGDIDVALRTVEYLVESGADVGLRCGYTGMDAINYCVYFDCGPILQYLLEVTQNQYIDDQCRDFDGGTNLHIAASNCCLESAKILVSNGANILLKDDLNRTPLFCVPEPTLLSDLMPETAFDVCTELKNLLEKATLAITPGEGMGDTNGNQTGKVVLLALGLGLGDRVIISNQKLGQLRYCGAAQFAPGIWAGVELFEPEGKNDGTVGGVTYFRCAPKHGVFAPINKITKFDENYGKYSKGMGSVIYRNVNHPKVDISRVTPKVETGLSTLKTKSLNSTNSDINIGKRVLLNDKRIGKVMFIGETEFAGGTFIGIELEKKLGKNDGSVNGIRYFNCRPNYGIFTTTSRIMRVLSDRKQTDESDDNSSELSVSISQSSTDNDVFKSPNNARKSRIKTIATKSQNTNQNSSLSQTNGNTCAITVGVNVFINNSIGVVRYIGPVESVGPGVWLGIELRTPTGKNDGSINGHKYWNCKPNHGILVRPKKVSMRGINGAKLLPQ